MSAEREQSTDVVRPTEAERDITSAALIVVLDIAEGNPLVQFPGGAA